MDEEEKMISCDVAKRLMHISLQEELTGTQRTQFYSHLSQCPSCQNTLHEMSDLEFLLSDMAKESNQCCISSYFTKDVCNRVQAVAMKPMVKLHQKIAWYWQYWKTVIKQYRTFLRGGAFAGLSLFLILSFSSTLPSSPPENRFQVQEITFQAPYDVIEWNTERLLLPGQMIYYQVNQNQHHSIHVRLIPKGSTEISIDYGLQDYFSSIQRQRMLLQRVQYATLKSPRPNDRISFRNEGEAPIQINSYTSQPQSVQIQLMSLH